MPHFYSASLIPCRLRYSASDRLEGPGGGQLEEEEEEEEEEFIQSEGGGVYYQR